MRVPTALLLCASALACSEVPSAPTSTPGTPNYAGATVEKFLDPFTLFPDFEAGRVFSVGIVNPIEDLCAGADPVFDGRLRQHFIVTPSGNVPELVASTGPATLVIYGAAPENPCDLSSEDILFRGTGRITVTSSDADFAPGGRRHSATALPGWVRHQMASAPEPTWLFGWYSQRQGRRRLQSTSSS